MKRRKIGIDFDDCLIDFCSAIISYYNSLYGTSYQKKDVLQFGLENLWKCSKEEADKVFADFYDIAGKFNILPVFGAPEGVREWSKNNDLFVVTGRSYTTVKFVNDWIATHMPFFKGILFTKSDSRLKKTKSQLCKENGIEILIDDHVAFVEDLSLNGIKGLIFDAPWNQGKIPENVTRVYSWDDVVARIL